MNNPSSKRLSIFSWNVRGLGQADKCRDVRHVLSSASPDIICLQETKLQHIDFFKARSFLPDRLTSFIFNPSIGASGGILIAWDDSSLELVNPSHLDHLISASFASRCNDLSFSITKAYGPCQPHLKPAFLDSILNLAASVSGPWALCGDFNLTRYPSDRSNDNFDRTEAVSFNDLINETELQEIPLMDRLYTWSNNQPHPILVKLDRFFVNIAWSNLFPDSTLSSATRTTSDHAPLTLSATSSVPRPQVFRFNNHWLANPSYKPLVHSNWNSVSPNHYNNSHTGQLCLKLKRVRAASKAWVESLRRPATSIKKLRACYCGS